MANLNLAQIQQLLRQTSWPESLIAKMAAIVMYESGGNPNAHNGNGEDSWGLLQINWPYHRQLDRSRLSEPVYNLSNALTIYNREGVGAWTNSNRKYNQNLNGIAAQSQAIYSGGGNGVIMSDFQPVLNQSLQNNSPDYVMYAAIGLLAVFLLRD